ncbi:hypothetical protein [Mesorhizobium sp. WSM4884]|uniref:hypothetical protein n=1 Tax=Mesorhizobium sp. WSM4884 TaxID=3038542 RepID=UPI0024175C89|nr:hypothetical protein [Mesorhizobium sp. WSM4884]MDG4880441.1 hypothetical protein [Mesorhizobium sp. WSM4884]
MLGRSCQIWQRDHRTASGTFGATLLAFGLALFLLLLSGQAQAHEFDASQDVSSANVIPSIGDCKVDRSISMMTVPAVSVPSEPGCDGGALQSKCDLCAGGHCFGCSAAVLAAASDVGLVAESYGPALLDQSSFALAKPDEAFRPPRSTP